MRRLSLILFIILPWVLSAQEYTVVSKEELLAQVSGENLQLKIAEQEVNLAQTDLLQSRALHLPNITLSYTGISTNNPLMAFGSKLNQERIQMSDFNPDFLNDPDNILNFATKLEVQQPIYNRDGVWQKKAGEVKVNAMQLKAERVKDYLAMEMSKAYMQLQLAHKALNVLTEAKNTALANKKIIDNYYANGMIQKSEVLYMEVRVNEVENQIKYAQSNIQNASDYISFLLNKEYGNTIYVPTEELTYDSNLTEIDPTLNTERTDIQAYEKSLEAYDLMTKSAEAKFLPRVNAFGSYEIYDDNPIGFNAQGYLVGVQASWNLFDGKKSDSEVKKYQAEKDKAEIELAQYKKQNQLELYTAWRKVQDADSNVALAKLAWEQTQEAYRIRKNRFDQGLEKSADLLTAETMMSEKELAYHQAIFEYNSALEYFKFLKK